MERIAVIGLGYVGLPVALAFARHHASVIGFDINPERIAALRAGIDATGEVPGTALAQSRLELSDDPADLAGATAFVVTVPTPVDRDRQPDLGPLRLACETIGPHLSTGALVVFESTVYPSVTEDICGPWLAAASGLAQGSGFVLGYSPERINPGDTEHTFERIVKVVAGQDAETLERVAALYGPLVTAGLHRAPSIKVAEAAKVIENTQRDLNIALMNELAVIFDRIGIASRDVLAAAGTKWNFLPFTPGLVGGHCIGVDPYYLTALAGRLGYHPEVILAGRRINDAMGAFIAGKTVKMLVAGGHAVPGARVGILGLTFKENVSDLRNTRVTDVVRELESFGIAVSVHDPLADPDEARALVGMELTPWEDLKDLSALVLAVPHRAYLEAGPGSLTALLLPRGLVIDVKSRLDTSALPENLTYWSP
ncbi:MAG: nucleotide sugar dehydrogenase [Azospirillaceae bacterium]